MARNSVVGIGVDIPGADIEEVSLRSKVSLLDYDMNGTYLSASVPGKPI